MESKQQVLELISKRDRERYHYLNELFKFVSDGIINEMAYMEVKKDQFILRAGQPSDTVYIILSGKVAGLEHQDMGRVYYFMDFTKMYVVGDFEVFGDYFEYCVSIRALTDCRLLKISSKRYIQWVQHDENALFLRIKNIIMTLTFERKIDREYVFLNCKKRLIKFLMKSYESGRKDSDGRYKILKTQAEIADRVGFSIRSVQRNIAALEKEEMISVENGKIVISDEQFLQLKKYNEEEKGNR